MINTVMKQKHLFLFFWLMLLALPTYAQNKIGNNPSVIQSGSLLELESQTKGLRLPRIPLNNCALWTLDGTPVSGMLIFNETGTEPKGLYYWSTDLSKWIQVVNKFELSTLIANYINQNTTVRDSIINVINNTITTGSMKGKDLTSKSKVIKVMNGTGAAIKDVQVDLDLNELGHLLNSSPVADSLSIVISHNTTIRDSITNIINNTITTGAIKGKDLTSNSKVIKVMNGGGAAIKDVQVDIDKNELGHLLNSSPVADSLSIVISHNTTIRDSIINVINNTITTGSMKGKDLTSNSKVIKVLNGAGAAIKDVQVDIDKNELGHLLNTTPVADSLSIVISNNTVIRDSIISIVKTSTTNTLTGESNKLTSKVNGVSADLAPTAGSISKTLGFDTNGKLVIQNPEATAITDVSNTSKGNSISTTVNGITGVPVDIINSNSISLVNGVLSSSVNGVTSSPGLNLISSADNGLSSVNGNVQLGGTLIKPTILSATTVNTLSIKGLQSGNKNTDSILVVAPVTGKVGKISIEIMGTNVYKLIAFASINNQKRFETPNVITDIKKIQVYRNGINIEFTQADDTHIDLEDQAACYVDDEIKIVQIK